MFLDKKYIYLSFIIGGTTCLMRVFSRKVQSFTGNFIPLLWPSLGQWKITPLFKILLDDPPQTSQRLYITSGIKCLGPLLQHQGELLGFTLLSYLLWLITSIVLHPQFPHLCSWDPTSMSISSPSPAVLCSWREIQDLEFPLCQTSFILWSCIPATRPQS